METPSRALRNVHLSNVHQQCTPLKVPASPFMQRLGYGTGVNVFRWDGGGNSPKTGNSVTHIRSPIAVKRISSSVTSSQGDEWTIYNTRIQKEAEILRKLSHPNIIRFIRFGKDARNVDCLVLECCGESLGDILERLQDPLPAEKTTKMISDIARALDYLHTEAKLLHGDLKSHNVLVKGDFEVCKLCDFGVSLPLDDEGVFDQNKHKDLSYIGTSLWCAPEVIDAMEVIDSKADIFSFGLIIYETIALTPPHMFELNEDAGGSTECDESTEESINSSADAYNSELLGTRPPLPKAFELTEDYNRIVEIFYLCTISCPEERPSARLIWQSLEEDPKEHKEELLEPSDSKGSSEDKENREV